MRLLFGVQSKSTTPIVQAAFMMNQTVCLKLSEEKLKRAHSQEHQDKLFISISFIYFLRKNFLNAETNPITSFFS